jgi:hypothetical protein
VWTWRGSVTYYTVFVIDLASRRVPIKGECLDRMIPPGERHFRRAITEFVEH